MRIGLVVSIVVLLFSCTGQESILNIVEPPAEPLVWVGKMFSGGKQCGGQWYTPPDTKRLLNNAGIGVAETRVVLHPVCEACDCPTYAATHYALISESQLTQAESLGFRRATPPEESGAGTGGGFLGRVQH